MRRCCVCGRRFLIGSIFEGEVMCFRHAGEMRRVRDREKEEARSVREEMRRNGGNNPYRYRPDGTYAGFHPGSFEDGCNGGPPPRRRWDGTIIEHRAGDEW